MTEDRIGKTPEQLIEVAVLALSGDNRFDKLVELRDAAQALIATERDKERERVAKEVEDLSARLASNKARLSGIEDLVQKARKPRSDSGKKREKKEPTPIKEQAADDPTGLTAYIRRVGLIAFNRILGQQWPGAVEGYTRAQDVPPENVTAVMRALEDEWSYQRDNNEKKAGGAA